MTTNYYHGRLTEDRVNKTSGCCSGGFIPMWWAVQSTVQTKGMGVMPVKAKIWWQTMDSSFEATSRTSITSSVDVSAFDIEGMWQQHCNWQQTVGFSWKGKENSLLFPIFSQISHKKTICNPEAFAFLPKPPSGLTLFYIFNAPPTLSLFFSHEASFYDQKQQSWSKGCYFLWQKKREDQITAPCLSHKFKLCSIGKIWSCSETRAIGISDHLTNKCHHTWHTRSSVTLTKLFSPWGAEHTPMRTPQTENGNPSDTFSAFGDSAHLSFDWQFDWRARVSRSFSLIYPFL